MNHPDNIPGGEQKTSWEMRAVARIHNAFAEKFGVPRQSGLVPESLSRVVLEPAYRSAEAVRGLEAFSHVWLLWVFDRAERKDWSPTVRPPRLGGNRRVGVFATRAPFRPNPIGLSCVRLIRVETDAEDGPALVVAGADLVDGTPILDIKPYLPYADCITEAGGGFTEALGDVRMNVVMPEELLERIPAEERKGLMGVLSRDPRPGYQRDTERIYGFGYAGKEIHFQVVGNRLTVLDVTETKGQRA